MNTVMGIKELFCSSIIVIGVHGADYKTNDVGRYLFDCFFPYQYGPRKIVIAKGFAENNMINQVKKSIVSHLNTTGDPDSIHDYKIQFFSKLNTTPCSYNIASRSCRLGNSINRENKIADLKVACNVYTVVSDGDLCNMIKSDVEYINDLLQLHRKVPCLILIDALVSDGSITDKICALCNNPNNNIKIFDNMTKDTYSLREVKQCVNVSNNCLNVSDNNNGLLFFGMITCFFGILEYIIKIVAHQQQWR